MRRWASTLRSRVGRAGLPGQESQTAPRLLEKVSGGLALAVCTLLLFVAGSRSLAQEYEVRGSLSYRMVRKTSGVVLMDQEMDFMMAVDGCRWFLRQTPRSFSRMGQPRAMEDYVVASTDLTNFYFLVSMETMAKAQPEASAERARAPLNVGAGMIGSGTVPYGTDPTVILLWYGLASGCYFRLGVTNEYIHGVVAFEEASYYGKDFRARGFWRLAPSPPYLPTSLVFTPDFRFLRDAPDRNFRKWPNPTNCVYSAFDFTNVGGLTVPRRARAEFPITNDLETTFEFTLATASARCSVKQFVPSIPPGSALISDYRTISGSTSQAVATGPTTNWPRLATSSAKLDIMLQQAAGAQRKTAARSIVRVLILSVVLTGLVPVWAVAQLRRKALNRTRGSGEPER
jgi:hypothetical protein